MQIGLRRDLYVTVPRGKVSSVKTTINVEPLLVAPLSAQQTGRNLQRYCSATRSLDKRNVYPLQDVPQGGWWRRMVDTMLLWFE